MGNATFAISGFIGGEISQFAQGRFDLPDYHVSLNVCLNAFPTEVGTWTRRPGSMFAGTTRGGTPGRIVKFDFSEANAVNMEFTDGKLRFRNGTVLITTNDAITVAAVSTANPAVVRVNSAVPWATGDTVVFDAPSPSALLENRQFIATMIDTTHFSLADALTGTGVNGAGLGTITSGTVVRRVHELTTSYVSQSWSSIRAVQAETAAVLLNTAVATQVLSVAIASAPGVNTQFALNAATFSDGPYLDPFTNGAQVVPNGPSGIVSLQVAFPLWSASVAYANGSFVTSSSVNYVSLIDQNAGNTPASSPTAWQTTSAGAAINGGQGFLGTDIGRLVRLYSEPVPWDVTATYTTGKEVVSYNPSGVPGGATYWQNQTAGNHGAAPGTDLINWKIIPQGAALWTWGKIVALSNVIDRALAGSSAIGNLSQNGGLNAAFDGIFTKGFATSARLQVTASGSFAQGTIINSRTYVGKVFASPKQIFSAVIFPSSDEGFGKGLCINGAGYQQTLFCEFTFILRGKQTPPANSSDGTLLGSQGPIVTGSAVSITSSDQVTAWNYVWVELIVTAQIGEPTGATFYLFDADIAQLSFFAPTGTGISSGVNVEILGKPLLYTNPILTWALGVYSNTTGWPGVGIYHEGRLILAGAIGNRFDACKAGGVVGNTINFAPTDAFGQVADDNAFSYTLDSDSVNPIFWMKPDLQGIVMGTQAGEFLVSAPSGGKITPTNILGRCVTAIGSAPIEPARTDHTLVAVQRFAMKVMEYFPDVYSGKFSAPNLAQDVQHITRAGVAEIAYQRAATPLLWGRDALNALFSITYKRDTLATSQGPTINGWARHTLGSGRVVESLCVGPSVGGNLDSLAMVTNDTTTNVRHVEVLTDAGDELDALSASQYLDNAVAPTSMSTSTAKQTLAPNGGATFNGLWHLNGKTVQVFAGGMDCGDRGDNNTIMDFVVANGSVFVPFGDGISSGCGKGLFTPDFVASFNGAMPVLIGFTYNSDGQIVRRILPVESGSRNGPALGLLRRNHRYAMLLSNTLGLSVGATFSKLYPANFKRADGMTALAALTTFSGIHQDSLQDDYTYDGMICWRVSRPYPANVAALSGNLSTKEQ